MEPENENRDIRVTVTNNPMDAVFAIAQGPEDRAVFYVSKGFPGFHSFVYNVLRLPSGVINDCPDLPNAEPDLDCLKPVYEHLKAHFEK